MIDANNIADGSGATTPVQLKTDPDANAFKRGGGLARSPRGASSAAIKSSAAEEAGSDSKSNLESSEGRDFWANPSGKGFDPLDPRNSDKLRPQTGADPKSNLESDEGNDYWSSLRGDSAGCKLLVNVITM